MFDFEARVLIGWLANNLASQPMRTRASKLNIFVFMLRWPTFRTASIVTDATLMFYLYYKTVRILYVCADEIEKTTGLIFKILFATDSDRFALGHCQKKLNFSLSQPISSNWMIFMFNIDIKLSEFMIW